MPDVTIVFWRDIPAQVIVGPGRRGHKVQLAERFEQREVLPQGHRDLGSAQFGEEREEHRRSVGDAGARSTQ